MGLSEDQIQRYSRHILLPDVGGVGQERLLATGVRVFGQGVALSTACTYLAAGGTPVQLDTSFQPAGFLDTKDAPGQLNPDAGGQTSNPGTLAAAPHTCSGPLPWILLSGNAVLYRSSDGCADCFALNAQMLSTPPDEGPAAVMLGALAALLFQKLVLGGAEPLGARQVTAGGKTEPMEVRKCSKCQ